MTHLIPSQTFQFLDVAFVFQCDQPEWLARFNRQYARFVIDRDEIAQGMLVLTFENGVFAVDGRVWPLSLVNGDGYVWLHLLIINSVIQYVQRFDLLHAGTLGWQGDGIMISGLSQHGKTTLTLALVQAGYQFLSDEFAALSRSDGLLYPLPRQVSIRPKTIPLLNLDHINQIEPISDGRRMVDIDLIRPNAVAPPLPLRHLFLLADADDAAPATRYVIVTNRVTDGWLSELTTLDSLTVLKSHADHTPPGVVVDIADPGAAFPGIVALCDAHDILLIHSRPWRPHIPHFDRHPTVRRIPRSEAAMRLLQHYQNGIDSVVFQQMHNGNPLRLFAHLTELIKDVTCWELCIGRLDETVTLINERLK